MEFDLDYERKLKDWTKNKLLNRNNNNRPRTTEIFRLKKSEDVYKSAKSKIDLLEKEVDGLKNELNKEYHRYDEKYDQDKIKNVYYNYDNIESGRTTV